MRSKPRFARAAGAYRAAVVQLTATADREATLAAAEALVKDAAAAGARLVALPENVSFLGPEGDKAARAEPLDGPTGARLSALARSLRIHLAAGSFPETSPDPARPYNTAALFGPDGALLCRYRKMHLFDLDLGPGGPSHRESATTTAGDEIVVTDTELGRVGMSICYDLRFPELYRAMGSVDLLLVPSAFTVVTGQAHWAPLLQARAIENQAYVLAAAQVGPHGAGRKSHGRSMIVDPWGVVLATCPDRPSVAFADIDLEMQADLRRRMPVASHRRRL